MMHGQLGVPLSRAGVISMLICVGTILSSLFSDHLTMRLGPGRVTALSVALTAAALFGFSLAPNFGVLCLLALPYGLGAGAVDAALNNFVALHYHARHMSWLHCFWGLGATVGPYIMGICLALGFSWPAGYRTVSALQVMLTAALVVTLPLWRRAEASGAPGTSGVPAGMAAALRTPGVPAAMTATFCYCAAEQTAALWAASYMVVYRGVGEELAARWAALFFIGITLGRFLSGVLTARFDDKGLIRLGQVFLALGVVLLWLPGGNTVMCAGFVCIGLGCAPIYPAMLHASPFRFGAELSQKVIGMQMASSYLGTALMPPLFGLLAERVSIRLMPWYLLVLTAGMALATEKLNRK